MCIRVLKPKLKNELEDEFIAYKVVGKKNKYSSTYYPIFFNTPIRLNKEIVKEDIEWSQEKCPYTHINWKPSPIYDYEKGIHLFINLESARLGFNINGIPTHRRILCCRVRKEHILAIGITNGQKVICVSKCIPLSVAKKSRYPSI